MKSTYYLFVVMLLVIFAFNSCSKDDALEPNAAIPANQYFGNSITISTIGRVLDESGNPISGATVRSGNKSTTTDNMGVFVLTNISAFEKLGFVTVEKSGYYKGIRSFKPKSGGNELAVTLLTKSITGTFNSSDGGTISTTGVSVTFDPNSIQLNNAPYIGVVNVSIKHINPASPNFRSEMPGSLVGVDNADSYGLVSYGMMAVELTNSSGQKLQIESGKTAEIRITVPPSLLANAPATIPLWSLDESLGVWKKESMATLINNVYIGNVSHFSFWNCDDSYDYVYLTSKIFDSQTKLPLSGYAVTISLLSNLGGGASDWTNSNGQVDGMVPANQVLNLTVSTLCGGNNIVLYNSTIGPFSADVNLDSIFVNTSQLVYTHISGQITDCNNQLLGPSYVVINGTYIVFASNGIYNAQVCDNSAVISAGFPWHLSTAQLLNLNGTPQVVNFQICNPLTTGTVTDFEGNVYRTVVIGSKTWTADNLRTTHFRNGTIIPTGLNNYYWSTTTQGYYSTMHDDTTGDYEYGKLYNWYVVADPIGLCPTGWHVPTDSDWIDLISLFGGELTAAPYLKEAGYSHWNYPNTSANNISGFTARPGGLRMESGPSGGRGEIGYWWSSSDYGANASVNSVYMDKTNFESFLQSNDRNSGLSVRCVKN